MTKIRGPEEQLKELFSKLSYDELVTLKFVTEEAKKEKPKRKYTKKKKVAEKTQEEPQTDTEGIAPESIRVDKLED